MIDTVAKAIFNKMARDVRGQRRYWETAPVEARELCRDLARAALSALLEPDDQMQVAGHKVRTAPLEGHPYPGTDEIFVAMINAALGESI